MASLGGKIAIVGVGETRYERRSGRPLGALMFEASRSALADAGVDASKVDGLVLPGMDYAGPHELARTVGVREQFFSAQSLSGGSGLVSSLLVAALAIDAGLATTVLCCQGIDWGSERRGNVGQPHAEMRMKAALEIPFGWYPQVVHFAGMARRHMELYGTTERQLGEVAVTFRQNARRTENAIYRKPLEIGEYLGAA